MKYQVQFTSRSRRAIDEYVDYIARERQEPINAGRVLGAIEDAMVTLESMPNRCQKAPEDKSVSYTIRMLIVKKTLLLLYRVNEKPKVVTVIGFRRSSQSPIHFD